MVGGTNRNLFKATTTKKTDSCPNSQSSLVHVCWVSAGQLIQVCVDLHSRASDSSHPPSLVSAVGRGRDVATRSPYVVGELSYLVARRLLWSAFFSSSSKIW